MVAHSTGIVLYSRRELVMTVLTLSPSSLAQEGMTTLYVVDRTFSVLEEGEQVRHPLYFVTLYTDSFGHSDGENALWIDSDLYRGHSGPSATFDNEPLSSTREFQIVDLEIWGYEL